MSHKQQRHFCESVRENFPQFFKHVSVLDVGSQDINGNNRYLFEDSAYFGCDVVAGKNVDHIGPCWTVPKSLGVFHVVISTEMLEHDETWSKSVGAMEDRVAPGGLLLITCAGPGRKIHHTPPGGYYKNLTPKDIVSVLDLSKWEQHEATFSSVHCDTFLWAIKKQ
jgi:hypothetical protein